MKLIIQIPCYNEQDTLRTTLEALPKHINGIDEIEILIIDDGSNDDTVKVAKDFGVKHVLSLPHNGLAKTFLAGINESLQLGADIIVNTDADNQYCADDIKLLVKSILEKKAEIVIGARPIDNIEHFSKVKKFLQKLGSLFIRLLSTAPVQDAPSGFRAFTRNAALQLNVFDNYTYTMETIIQASAKGLSIISVPINVNAELRKSKLITNIFSYIKRSVFTVIRMFIVYRPFKFFALISSLFLFLGFILCARFLYFYIINSNANGHVQSLILAAILIITGFQIGLIAILADLLSINRKLLEDIQIRLKLKQSQKDEHQR